MTDSTSDSRRTATRLQALDGWRGLAVLAVLLGHFVPGLGTDAPVWGVNLGRVGVELFFALSGCLMAPMLFGPVRVLPLGTFARRRFARIVPSMWLFLAVALVVAKVRGDWVGVRAPLLALAGGLNWMPALGWGDPATVIAHLWSVGVELQGYLLLGLIAALVRRTGDPAAAACRLMAAALVAILALIGWGALQGAAVDYYARYWRTDHRLVAMLAGALLVTLHDHGRLRLPAGRAVWIGAVLAGLVLQVNAVPDALKYSVGALLIAVGCAALARAGEAAAAWLTRPLPVALGAASFSLYLWQQLFYASKDTLGSASALVLALLAGFVAHHGWDQRLHYGVARRLARRGT